MCLSYTDNVRIFVLDEMQMGAVEDLLEGALFFLPLFLRWYFDVTQIHVDRVPVLIELLDPAPFRHVLVLDDRSLFLMGRIEDHIPHGLAFLDMLLVFICLPKVVLRVI